MRTWLREERGQSIGEYAILVVVVVAAFAAMQVYTKRGLQARVKNGTDALTNITTTISSANDGALTTTFASQSQYEPYYAESFGQTYQENVEQQHQGSGKVVLEKVSDVTARTAGSYQKQKGATDRTTADALWQ